MTKHNDIWALNAFLLWSVGLVLIGISIVTGGH
jgi:hypothetical protein